MTDAEEQDVIAAIEAELNLTGDMEEHIQVANTTKPTLLSSQKIPSSEYDDEKFIDLHIISNTFDNVNSHVNSYENFS